MIIGYIIGNDEDCRIPDSFLNTSIADIAHEGTLTEQMAIAVIYTMRSAFIMNGSAR